MSLTPPRLRRGSVPARGFTGPRLSFGVPAPNGMGGAQPLPPNPPAASARRPFGVGAPSNRPAAGAQPPRLPARGLMFLRERSRRLVPSTHVGIEVVAQRPLAAATSQAERSSWSLPCFRATVVTGPDSRKDQPMATSLYDLSVRASTPPERSRSESGGGVRHMLNLVSYYTLTSSHGSIDSSWVRCSGGSGSDNDGLLYGSRMRSSIRCCTSRIAPPISAPTDACTVTTAKHQDRAARKTRA